MADEQKTKLLVLEIAPRGAKASNAMSPVSALTELYKAKNSDSVTPASLQLTDERLYRISSDPSGVFRQFGKSF